MIEIIQEPIRRVQRVVFPCFLLEKDILSALVGEGVATYRRHHKGGDSTALDGGHDGGDEDEYRSHRVVEELLQ